MTTLRAIVVAVLLVGMLLPLAAMDIVLCFGADGHVLLEASHDGRCGTSTFPRAFSRPQPGVGLSSVDHCSPCVDIPMLTADARAHPITLVSNPALSDGVMLACVTSLVAAFIDVTPPPFFSSSPPGFSPILTALRTVVLLI
jgi:hypothetical protein